MSRGAAGARAARARTAVRRRRRPLRDCARARSRRRRREESAGAAARRVGRMRAEALAGGCMKAHEELVGEPRERLVEVLLGEAMRTERSDAHAVAPPRVGSLWLPAAIVLLGVGVVIGTMLLRVPAPSAVVPAQDPQQLPR